MKKVNTAINNEKNSIDQYLLELVPKSCRPYVEKAVEDLIESYDALSEEIKTLREEIKTSIEEIKTLREETKARDERLKAQDEAMKILAKEIERLNNNNYKR